MASRRLEKYRLNNKTEVNNNEENFKIELPSHEIQSPQEYFRDWFKCICERPSTAVVCTNRLCSFCSHGRVRKLCRVHPNVTYLLDLPVCPECQYEVVEVFTPN